MDAKCPNCSGQYRSIRRVTHTSKYLVLLVTPVSQDDKQLIKLPTKIKEVPTKILSSCNKNYRLKAMIMHGGQDLNNGSRNHYTAWVNKARNWLCISDDIVTPHLRWPTNSYICKGYQSPHALFYEEF